MQSSSNTSTFPIKQQQRQHLTCLHRFFKDYQPKPKLKLKPKPKLRLNIQHPLDPPQIQDLRQLKVVLHRLKLPLSLQQELQQQKQRSQGTQTTDLYAQQRKEASTQTTTTTTTTTATTTDDLDLLDSSFSEDELEEIKRFIAESEPKQEKKAPAPEHDREQPQRPLDQDTYHRFTESLAKLEQHLDNIEEIMGCRRDRRPGSPHPHVSAQ